MVLGQKYQLGTAATAKIINLWSKGLTFFSVFTSLLHSLQNCVSSYH